MNTAWLLGLLGVPKPPVPTVPATPERKRELLFAAAVRLEGRDWLLAVTLCNVLVWAGVVFGILGLQDQLSHTQIGVMLFVAAGLMTLHLIYAWLLALSTACVVREDIQGYVLVANVAGSLILHILAGKTSSLITSRGAQVHWVYNTWYVFLLLIRFDASLSLQLIILISVAIMEADALSYNGQSPWQAVHSLALVCPWGQLLPLYLTLKREASARVRFDTRTMHRQVANDFAEHGGITIF